MEQKLSDVICQSFDLVSEFTRIINVLKLEILELHTLAKRQGGVIESQSKEIQKLKVDAKDHLG